ncbi:hypothetical protein M3650_26430 [Paenibacillus sp. MER TA 81-3]|uniref:hypothetical protein n=1 Tax=Paenibacillus sp. MER TA 81-3 TaxID=2939573 RepID=UPI00203DF01B|nr:hypothetical protein [Paenibacillus sp. MER TA 81-3]MCM3342066.1 hypothetical protein [Paenibacillus sp. MER TA 81-3]
MKEINEDGVKKKVSAASNWLKLAYHVSRIESLSCKLKYVGGDRYWLVDIIDSGESKARGEYSLFRYFIQTNSSGFRTWAANYLVDDIPRADYVWSNDYWTKGILHTVNNQSFNSN